MNKEEREREQLRLHRQHMEAKCSCSTCSVPTRRELLVHGQCPGCRSHDAMKAKEGEHNG